MKYTAPKIHIKKSLSIAKSAVNNINNILKKSRVKTSDALIKQLENDKDRSFRKLKEPLMKNAVSSILFNIPRKGVERTKHKLKKNVKNSLDHINNSNDRISDYGYKKIKRGMVVYTHGFSLAVLDVLIKAKKEGIKFEVYNTETRPVLSGREMATELAKAKIPVKHFTDFALRQALKKSDIVLMGANTISNAGQVYSNIGSELISEVAEKYDIPVYICMDSWKFNPSCIDDFDAESIDNHKQVWHKPPKGVKVLNYSFEKIHPALISGLITEMGIYKPHYLVSEIKKQHPWIMKV